MRGARSGEWLHQQRRGAPIRGINSLLAGVGALAKKGGTGRRALAEELGTIVLV